MNMQTTITPRHFVLVHGICHGAWCWYKVVSHLESAGHRVTAVDLGGCGVHPSQLEDVASFSDYVQPLIQVFERLSGDDRVVVVGHSYGGLAISAAMERFPKAISVGVFITSYMPTCNDPPALQMNQYFKGLTPEIAMDCRFTFNGGVKNPATSIELGPNYMAAKMYRNCQSEDLALAKMLVRPGGFYIEDMSKDSFLTKEGYGSVKRVFMVCEGDEVMSKEFQRFVIENSPPNEVKSIAKAGHMIMLSKPEDLCFYLLEIASKYP